MIYTNNILLVQCFIFISHVDCVPTPTGVQYTFYVNCLVFSTHGWMIFDY